MSSLYNPNSICVMCGERIKEHAPDCEFVPKSFDWKYWRDQAEFWKNVAETLYTEPDNPWARRMVEINAELEGVSFPSNPPVDEYPADGPVFCCEEPLPYDTMIVPMETGEEL